MRKLGQTGDFLSIVYFLFLLILIALPIFLTAKVLLSKEYDSRLDDASLMSVKVENCLEGKSLSLDELKDLPKFCDLDLRDNTYVLHLYAGDKELYKYGDSISCELYNLNKQNARCVNAYTSVELDGSRTQIRILSGSNIGGNYD